jgi:hypothetical protein
LALVMGRAPVDCVPSETAQIAVAGIAEEMDRTADILPEIGDGAPFLLLGQQAGIA